MYYLYIKQHNITKLKYLGYTASINPFIYQGSGKYWKLHIKKHGNHVTTHILLATKDLEDIRSTGIFFSKLFNVVNSDEWANLKEESGNGGWDYVNSLPVDKQAQIARGSKLGLANKNTVAVKDSHNNYFRVSTSDVRLLSGDLVGHTKGTSYLYDSYGDKVSVPTGTRIEKYHGNNHGKFYITNGVTNKLIKPGDTMPDGCYKGISSNKNQHNRGKIWITDGISEKMVLKNTILEEGWKRGRR